MPTQPRPKNKMNEDKSTLYNTEQTASINQSQIKRFYYDNELHCCDKKVSVCNNLKQLMCSGMDQQNSVDLMDNFLHLLEFHTSNEEFELIYDELGGFCDLKTCNMFSINHRNRFDDDFKQSGFNSIMQEKVFEEIQSKIHCFYRHSFDIGYRLNGKEMLQISENNDLKDNNETDMHTLLLNKKLSQFSQIIFAKKQNVKAKSNINLHERILNRSDPFKVDSKQTENANIYSFGQGFSYKYYREHGLGEIVCPKYSTFKEESTSNKVCLISMEQFNAEYKKALLHYNSVFRKKEYPFIGLINILALMIYCNYDVLQSKFSETYRDNIDEH
eukprot:174963_1